MKNKAFQITAILLLAGLFVFVGFSFPREQARGYVMSNELYDNFRMKQELESRLVAMQTAWQNELDSLRMQLEFKAKMYKEVGEENVPMLHELQNLDKYLTQKTTQYDELNRQETQAAVDQIWTQLNRYIKEFGEANGYEYIYGANGDGVVMYADPAKDVTDDLVNYVNTQYAGL